MDLSVFDKIHLQSEPNCNDYKECISIQRLLTSLKYYSRFELQSNQSDREIFTNFANEVYNLQTLIGDFNHFQKRHDHQLNDIMRYINDNEIYLNCNIDSCDHSTRHYRIQNDNNILNNIDPRLNPYQDTLDSFHFYLMHLHHVGLRCIPSNETSVQDNDAKDDKTQREESYDPEFARIGRIITSTRNASNRFNRISSGNKYNIEMGNNIETEVQQKDNDNMTYLDTVVEHLYKVNIQNDSILRLVNYLKNEKFDTESMDMDVDITNKSDSNISKHMANHKECMDAVIGMLKRAKGTPLFVYIFVITFVYESWYFCSFYRCI